MEYVQFRVDQFRFFLRILNWLMWHVLRGGVKITCSNSEFFLSAPSTVFMQIS